MAEIHLARSPQSAGRDHPVVVKLLLPHFMCDQEFVELFLDEARLAIQLDHENIGRVHDSGMLDGRYFFAMEYLHGKDVRDLLDEILSRGARVPLEHALTIASQVASALHYAHGKKGADGESLEIVHRDVSPANIIVTYDGQVKLVDFGISRNTARTAKTRTGTIRGKSEYMSPEQCIGRSIDARSDLFSLGIVLYELVTATRLFRPDSGESDYQVMDRIVRGDVPPPSRVVADLPDAVERMMMRALARDPDERYSSADELRRAVDELARDLGMFLSTSALSRYLVEVFGREPEPWRDGDDDAAIPDAVSAEPTSRRLILPLPADDAPSERPDEGDGDAIPRQISVEQTLPTPPMPIELDLVSIEFVRPRRPRPWLWVLVPVVLAGALIAWWV